MAEVDLQGVSRYYPGSKTAAVQTLDLHVNDGEFMVLVGPSGSGKTTALRMLAGLEPVSEGVVRIGGREVTHLSPQDRDIAMVFQNYALYPQKTVRENIDFPLRMHKVGKEERDRRIADVAKLLGLEELLDRKPKALSGGQRQRVAMGRAIVREPQTFLMDEPLSNLDAKLRVQTRVQIAALQKRLEVTTVYVTHDQIEAMTMGDRVAVLRDGQLQQCASPRALYESPSNVFVAGFIGSPGMNLREVAVLDGERVLLGKRSLPLPARLRTPFSQVQGDHLTIGIRPEHFKLVAQDSDLYGEVALVEELGADALLHVSVEGLDDPLVVRTDGRRPAKVGETLHLTVLDDDIFGFHPVSGARM